MHFSQRRPNQAKASAAGIQNFVRNDANSTPKHAHRGHHAAVGRLEDPYFAPFTHGGAVLIGVIGLFDYLRIVVTLFSAVPEPQPSTQRLDWSTAFLLGGLAVLLADTARRLWREPAPDDTHGGDER
jgi:hypothetical protein